MDSFLGGPDESKATVITREVWRCPRKDLNLRSLHGECNAQRLSCVGKNCAFFLSTPPQQKERYRYKQQKSYLLLVSVSSSDDVNVQKRTF